MGKFYAVKNGRQKGVYATWNECKAQVDGFGGAVYKSFATQKEAEDFISEKQKTLSTKSECVAYVDGSFDLSTFCYAYGAVIFYQNEKYTFNDMMRDEEMATMRNVAGEIEGAKKAMAFALEHGCKTLEICYDYQGIEKWCTGEWKANKKGTIAYRDYYLEMSKYMEISFTKIKGHSNHPLNDEADLLAKKALGLA